MDFELNSVDEIMERQRTGRTFLWIGMLAVVCFVFGFAGIVIYFANASFPIVVLAGLVAIIVLAIPYAIWQHPRTGLFMLYGGAMLFEGATNGFNAAPNIPTTFVPFFWNLNNVGNNFHVGGLGPLKFSLAEVIIILTLVSWVVRTVQPFVSKSAAECHMARTVST